MTQSISGAISGGIGPVPGAGRLDLIDAARGGAFVIMAVYHFCWDLTFFGLAELPLLTDPVWLGLRTAILSAFLGLAGVSMVLAARGGLNPRAWLRRLALLALCAGAITLASRLIIADYYIFFGVLHLLTVASVLGLDFLRLPALALAAAGAACLAAPLWFADPLFDRPELQWIGLMTFEPDSNDYVPVLPWFGVVLLGMAAGRVLAAADPAAVPALGWRAESTVARALRWAGRNSLLLYMVHQPVLIGLLAGIVAASGVGTWPGQPVPRPDAAARAAFIESCRTHCLPTGSEAACAGYCDCALSGFDAEGLSASIGVETLTEAERATIERIIRRCSADWITGRGGTR